MRPRLRSRRPSRLRRRLLRPPGGRLRLRRDPRPRQPGHDRGRPGLDLALPRIPAGRGRPDRCRHRLHPPAQGQQPGPSPRPAQPVHQERRRQHADALLQGPGGVGGPHPGPRAWLHHRELRLHRQPSQLHSRHRRPCRSRVLRVHPQRPGAGQGARHPHLQPHADGGAGQLRPGESSLLGGGQHLRLGLCEHQPAPLLLGGLQNPRLRGDRAARLAAPRPHRRSACLGLAVHQDPNS